MIIVNPGIADGNSQAGAIVGIPDSGGIDQGDSLDQMGLGGYGPAQWRIPGGDGSSPGALFELPQPKRQKCKKNVFPPALP